MLDNYKRIVLASKSPRRYELISYLGKEIVVVDSECEEFSDNPNPAERVRELALQKAAAVAVDFPEDIVVGADTIVVVDSRVLGKPQHKEEAKQMLTLLSGRSHEVYTGVAIVLGDKRRTFSEMSKVTMYPNSEEMIVRYIETGEPMDKAGAYGIQGKGALLVERIDGDFYNVMGLPISRLYRELEKC